MKILIRDQDHRIADLLGIAAEIILDGSFCLRFHFLSLAVHLIQLVCQFGGFLFILREKEGKRQFSVSHTTGGIQPRRNGIGHIGLIHVLKLEPQGGAESADPDEIRLREHPYPLGNDVSVLQFQGHDIPDRPDRCKHAVFLDRVLDRDILQRRRHLQRDPDPGDILEFRRVIQPVRIDYRNSGWDLLPCHMVIRDHHIDALAVRVGCLVKRRDPVVHRNDQGYAPVGELIDHIHGKAIAGSLPGRKRAERFSAKAAHTAIHQGRRGESVRVVIAVDRDGLFITDSSPDPLDGLVHILAAVRIKLHSLAVQKSPGTFRIAIPPGRENPGGKFPYPELIRDPVRCPEIRLMFNPSPDCHFFTPVCIFLLSPQRSLDRPPLRS